MGTAVQPLSGTFAADREHSSIQAALRHMGVGWFRTGFDEVEARLERDAQGPRLTGRAKVESIAIRRPAEFRAHVVDGADFFDARNHPEITFASHALTFGSDGAVELDGVLTMRGVARPISARGTYRGPIEDIYGKRRAALDLEASVDRRDWGMNFQAQLPAGGHVLSWEVEITVHLELVEQDR
jgi:polyisoprenoid-binding protein YceI